MQPFKKLSVWRKAHELTLRVYAASASISNTPHLALALELRRSAQAIPATVADGSMRATAESFAAALAVAAHSAQELDYLLLLARDLALITPADHAALEARADQVLRMLRALRRTVLGRSVPAKTSRPHAAQARAATGDAASADVAPPNVLSPSTERPSAPSREATPRRPRRASASARR